MFSRTLLIFRASSLALRPQRQSISTQHLFKSSIGDSSVCEIVENSNDPILEDVWRVSWGSRESVEGCEKVEQLEESWSAGKGG